MVNEKELAEECSKFNRYAQKELYRLYSAKMRGVCIRYAKDSDEAKDMLQEGFINVYKNIGKFSGSGSLEGWIRRIMVNTAITMLNKSKKHKYNIPITAEVDLTNEEIEDDNDEELSPEFSKEMLLGALNNISEEFRIVFNLYFIEDYSHKEISALLNINENTSRSRLLRARNQLKFQLSQLKVR